jgi:uncharacterized coiled-coil protein SlyX
MLEKRVDHLEDLVAEVWHGFAETDRRLDERFAETDRRLDERFAETDERFKHTERMIASLSVQVQQTTASVERMSEEIKSLSKEVKASQKQWGELSNRMGRLVEDFVYPSIPRILCTAVGCPASRLERVAIRLRCRHPVDPEREQEFDALAVCGDYVLINETKSRLDPEDVDDFIQVMSEARDFFPEYADRHFIGAVASLSVDKSVVRYGQRQGFLVLGVSEMLMEVLNDPGFAPKAF